MMFWLPVDAYVTLVSMHGVTGANNLAYVVEFSILWVVKKSKQKSYVTKELEC